MKFCKNFFLIVIAFVLILSLSACGKPEAGAMSGNWAYSHDPDKAALKFKGSSAVLDGVKYSYTVEGEFIMLTRGDKTTPLRYLPNKDDTQMYIYKPAVYTLESGRGEGIVGKWVSEDKKWSFEFDAGGKFNEDGYFPGQYALDSEAGTFKLMYVDHFEDTVCYYTIDGDTLTVEYPWPMVKIQ